MSDDKTHVTLRALAFVRGEPLNGWYGQVACGTNNTVPVSRWGEMDERADLTAIFVVSNDGGPRLSASGIPTCPRCAVEWDRACEERDGPLPS